MIRRAPACALALAAVLTAACDSGGAAEIPSSLRPSGPTSTTQVSSSAPSSGSTSAAPTALPGAAKASARIRTLTASLGSGGVSVAALRTDAGAMFRYGATGGMACASIAKLFILETLLLQRQDDGEQLSDGDRDAATRMIENSDNAAADQLYGEVGTVDGLNAAAHRLHVRNTQPGENYLWGFTESSAADFVALLRNLVAPSALDHDSRLFAIGLLGDVEEDQRWGVSAADDSDDNYLIKNGWLPSDPDDGRWIVNSVGVVTVHGHQVLMAVLTQHGDSFEGGIDRVEQISRIAAGVVAP